MIYEKIPLIVSVMSIDVTHFLKKENIKYGIAHGVLPHSIAFPFFVTDSLPLAFSLLLVLKCS